MPGRDLRFIFLSVEPALKIRIRRIHIDLKMAPVVHIPIRGVVENYVHSCGASGASGFISWENTAARKMSPVLLGGMLSFTREIRLGKNFYLFLEPGFEGYFSYSVKTSTPDGNFELRYLGFFLNVGFFR